MTSEKVLAGILRGLGPKATFVEVGVLRATTITWIADNCENVEKVIGVDSYKPYQDYLYVAHEVDQKPHGFSPSCYAVDQELANLNLAIAKEKIAASKNHNKIHLVLKDCVLAAKDFEDNSLTCVFLDAYLTGQQVVDHILTWLPKVKSGGILCGHDIESVFVQAGLEKLGVSYETPCRDVWIHKKQQGDVKYDMCNSSA